MSKYGEVVKLAQKNNRIVTTALVQKNGIASQYLTLCFEQIFVRRFQAM